MSADLNSRRGFLRGLASLPLIGGGLTLIGNPVAAAPPVTDHLLSRYVAWLAHEHRAALVDQARRRAEGVVADMIQSARSPAPDYVEACARDMHDFPHMMWFPDAPDIIMRVHAERPSTRAAVVLAAVGCDWGEGAR